MHVGPLQAFYVSYEEKRPRFPKVLEIRIFSKLVQMENAET